MRPVCSRWCVHFRKLNVRKLKLGGRIEWLELPESADTKIILSEIYRAHFPAAVLSFEHFLLGALPRRRTGAERLSRLQCGIGCRPLVPASTALQRLRAICRAFRSAADGNFNTLPGRATRIKFLLRHIKTSILASC